MKICIGNNDFSLERMHILNFLLAFFSQGNKQSYLLLRCGFLETGVFVVFPWNGRRQPLYQIS